MKVLIINGGNKAGKIFSDYLLINGYDVVVSDKVSPEVFKHLNPNVSFLLIDGNHHIKNIIDTTVPDCLIFINAFDYENINHEKFVEINGMNSLLLDVLKVLVNKPSIKFFYCPFYKAPLISEGRYNQLKPFRELVFATENYIKLYETLFVSKMGKGSSKKSSKEADWTIFHDIRLDEFDQLMN